MGSYASFLFDEHEVLSAKSFVPDELVSLFQEADRVEETESEDDGNSYQRVLYRASRSTILQRFYVLGVTEEVVREEFENWRRSEIAMMSEWSHVPSELEHLKTFTHDEWMRRVPRVLATRYDSTVAAVDAIDEFMKDRNDPWLWLGDFGSHVALRAMLDACPEVTTVTLDISDLADGHYLAMDVHLCDEARFLEPRAPRPLAPTIVLGEGSSDMRVLQLSLDILFPEVKDYFSFFNHTTLRVDGGTSYVVKFLKAFAAAKAPVRLVAIFDNDTVGQQARAQAVDLNLPENFIVMCLPDSELAKSYPTIGPQGTAEMNVNGQAASIELYLGRDALSRDGSLRPVRWSGYVQQASAYQGEVEGKAEVLARFVERIEKHRGAPAAARAEFPDLTDVWRTIIEMVGDRAATALRSFRASQREPA